MGVIWWAVPLVVGLFGAILVLSGLGHLVRGRPGKSSARLLPGIPLAIVGMAASLLGFNAQTFSRLTYESAVADVSVREIDPSRSTYAVTVKRLDGSGRSETCTIQGDEWLLSGRVQKWKPWANVLGLNATYSLDQISNMYFDAARGNGKTITSCDIGGPRPNVAQYVPPWMMQWLIDHAYAEDRRFGSANYMPLADGAVYRVVITQSGFNAEPSNDIARRANNARS